MTYVDDRAGPDIELLALIARCGEDEATPPLACLNVPTPVAPALAASVPAFLVVER